MSTELDRLIVEQQRDIRLGNSVARDYHVVSLHASVGDGDLRLEDTIALDEGKAVRVGRKGKRRHARLESSAGWKRRHPSQAREYQRRDNAKRGAAKRAWENANDRGVCACGNTLAVGAKRRGIERCRACEDQRRGIERSRRRVIIAASWEAGLSTAMIAKRIDWTPNSLSVEINRMRRDGWSLPYRQKPSTPTFPEQVAA